MKLIKCLVNWHANSKMNQKWTFEICNKLLNFAKLADVDSNRSSYNIFNVWNCVLKCTSDSWLSSWPSVMFKATCSVAVSLGWLWKRRRNRWSEMQVRKPTMQFIPRCLLIEPLITYSLHDAVCCGISMKRMIYIMSHSISKCLRTRQNYAFYFINTIPSQKYCDRFTSF